MEIVIAEPAINHDNYRSYAYEDSTFRSVFQTGLDRRGINPATHPMALDLCAGDGSLARILVDKNWDFGNITCVDRFRTTTPLQEGVNWRYWDLKSLGYSIIDGKELPEEILNFQHKFDVVLLWNGNFTKEVDEAVCRFFAHQGSIIFSDHILFELA
jgi:hypothetical protein